MEKHDCQEHLRTDWAWDRDTGQKEPAREVCTICNKEVELHGGNFN